MTAKTLIVGGDDKSLHVMPGLDPGIHPFRLMDGRVEPGHDS
jgi:hypothetical protein